MADAMRSLVLPFAALLALSACGGAARPSGPEPRVTLKLTAPNDSAVLRADHVQVQGTVSPSGAAVQVGGRRAEVQDGSFSASVALDPGANVIDVSASAAGRRAEVGAVRVVRDMHIKLPPLVGAAQADAEAQLAKLGFEVDTKRGGSLLDRFFGGDLQVCESDPPGGTLVLPHTVVTIVVARNC
jgi:hypothetical protein